MSDAKLSTLLDWVPIRIKDFPFNGPLWLETWQVMGQRLFDTIRDSYAKACRHLAMWGTIMVAIKENCRKADHFAASEANSPELSVPPKPVTHALQNCITLMEIPVQLLPLALNSHTEMNKPYQGNG